MQLKFCMKKPAKYSIEALLNTFSLPFMPLACTLGGSSTPYDAKTAISVIKLEMQFRSFGSDVPPGCAIAFSTFSADDCSGVIYTA